MPEDFRASLFICYDKKMKFTRGHIFFVSSSYLIAMALLLGFIVPNVHFPVVIELILKFLAVMSVIAIVTISLLNSITYMRSPSLFQLFRSPLSATTTVLSIFIALDIMFYLSGTIYGKPSVAFAFLGLIVAVFTGLVFRIVQQMRMRHSTR